MPSQPVGSELERNRRLVIDHFDDFVNKRDLHAIERNMTPDFLDHDGPGGQPTGVDGDCRMMAGMHQVFPDLHVEVLDAIAEADEVVVRNRWTATDQQTGKRLEFHGFVLWRIAAGKIAERWATVTPPHEAASDKPAW